MASELRRIMGNSGDLEFEIRSSTSPIMHRIHAVNGEIELIQQRKPVHPDLEPVEMQDIDVPQKYNPLAKYSIYMP